MGSYFAKVGNITIGEICLLKFATLPAFYKVTYLLQLGVQIGISTNASYIYEMKIVTS